MKFSPKFIAIALILVSLLAASVDYFVAIQQYEQLRRDARAPCLEAHPIAREEERFLKEVKNSWSVLAEGPDSETLLEICEIMDFESSVEGLVQALTHGIPPFSFWDNKQNLREAGRAGALSVIEAESLSVDGRIYSGDGVAFIKVRENIIEFYRDSPQGVTCVIYGTPESNPE